MNIIMRINEDYLDNIDSEDVISQHDSSETAQPLGKWWLVQMEHTPMRNGGTKANDSSVLPKIQKQIHRFFQISNINLHKKSEREELFDSEFLPPNAVGAISFDCNFRTYNETFRFFKFLCKLIRLSDEDFIIDYKGDDENMFFADYHFSSFVVADYWMNDYDVSKFITSDASKMMAFLFDVFEIFKLMLPNIDPTKLIHKLDEDLFIGDFITFCKINGLMQITGKRPKIEKRPLETAELIYEQEFKHDCRFCQLHVGSSILCGEGLRAAGKTSREHWNSTIIAERVSIYYHSQLRLILLGFMSNVIDGFPFYVFAEFEIKDEDTVETFCNGLCDMFPNLSTEDVDEIRYELEHIED